MEAVEEVVVVVVQDFLVCLDLGQHRQEPLHLASWYLPPPALEVLALWRSLPTTWR